MSDEKEHCSVPGCKVVACFTFTLKGVNLSTHAELCGVHGRTAVGLCWAMLQTPAIPPAYPEEP